MADEIEDDKGLPKGYLSPSQLNTYVRCGLQYWFRYVEGKVIPPGVALIEGSSCHKALEMNNRNKMLWDRSLPTKRVIEVFDGEWTKKKKEVENWEGDTPDNVAKRGRVVLTHYMQDFAPKVGKVMSVEAKFRADIGGVPIVGVVDLEANIEGNDERRILDYKFSNKPIREEDLKHHVQLGVYAEVFGNRNVGIIRVERKAQGKIETTTAALSPNSGRIVRAVVGSVTKGVKAGVFIPTDPGNWWCSEKWCGYWKLCRGANKGSPPSLPT